MVHSERNFGETGTLGRGVIDWRAKGEGRTDPGETKVFYGYWTKGRDLELKGHGRTPSNLTIETKCGNGTGEAPTFHEGMGNWNPDQYTERDRLPYTRLYRRTNKTLNRNSPERIKVNMWTRKQ